MGDLVKIQPWLPQEFLEVFSSWNTKTWKMWEYGSGMSTKWFAQRVHHLTSMEHSVEWHRAVKKACRDLDNVNLLRCDLNKDYVTKIRSYPNAFFDMVLVDGRRRVQCFKEALPKAKGVIALDNGLRSKYAEVLKMMEKEADWSYYVAKWRDPVIRDGNIIPVKDSWHTCIWINRGFSVK